MSKIRLHGTSSGYTDIAPTAAAGNNTLTAPTGTGTIVAQDAAGAIGITSVQATNANFSGTTRITSGISTTLRVTTGISTTLQVGGVNVLNSDGVNTSGIVTATHFNPTVQPYGTKNLIINGAVLISQRNGTSNTTIASGATYGPDRIAARSQTGSGHVLSQNTESPAGFTYSAKVTIGTGGSPAAGNKNYLYQPIEGYNVAHLDAGTSDAKTVTFSFWVRSSVTGNFGAAITSGAADHSYTFPYTINSADTWEKKTKTITLPTSGGTWNTGNTAGLIVFWDLGSGSDYEGTANQWNSALDVRSSSDVKLVATSSATFYVTGIQLEVGSVATPFEHRSQGDELRKCMRYCQKVFNAQLIGTMNTSARMRIMTNFPVPMRGTPSYTRTSTDLSFQKAASNETSSDTTEAQGATTATADGNAYARTWDFGGFSSLADRTFIGGNGAHVFTLDSEM